MNSAKAKLKNAKTKKAKAKRAKALKKAKKKLKKAKKTEAALLAARTTGCAGSAQPVRAFGVAVPARRRSSARTNGSSPPSSTPCTLPTSVSVRWSLTIV